MNICNWGVAMQNYYFGWEPRAAAPDHKGLHQKLRIRKKRNRKNSTFIGDNASDLLSPNVEFFRLRFFL